MKYYELKLKSWSAHSSASENKGEHFRNIQMFEHCFKGLNIPMFSNPKNNESWDNFYRPQLGKPNGAMDFATTMANVRQYLWLCQAKSKAQVSTEKAQFVSSMSPVCHVSDSLRFSLLTSSVWIWSQRTFNVFFHEISSDMRLTTLRTLRLHSLGLQWFRKRLKKQYQQHMIQYQSSFSAGRHGRTNANMQTFTNAKNAYNHAHTQ